MENKKTCIENDTTEKSICQIAWKILQTLMILELHINSYPPSNCRYFLKNTPWSDAETSSAQRYRDSGKFFTIWPGVRVKFGYGSTASGGLWRALSYNKLIRPQHQSNSIVVKTEEFEQLLANWRIVESAPFFKKGGNSVFMEEISSNSSMRWYI